MQSARKLLEDLLVENEGFQDLRTPVLLASGQVGIYYVFTEKTFPGLDFKIYGDDAAQMQNYVLHQMKNAKKFMQIMNSVAERAKELLKYSRKPVISGGQTRDWLFSMVVAKILNMPHVAIYKPEGGQNDRYEILSPSGKVLPKKYLRGADAVHVVDLITEASSCYSEDEQGKQVGWIPILRRAGVKVHNLLAMISRKEGGEKNLAKVDVTVESCVQVDADFLRKHAKHKRIALTYVADPEAWAKNYIARHGLKAFERSFCPAGTELERARRFLQRYGNVLKKTGRLKELDAELHREYGFSAIELAHGKNSYTKGNTFTKSWQKAVQKKNSLLCAGLDPGEYWSQNKDTLPKSANKFKWCLQYIDDIAPYAAAVKINRQFIKGLGEQKIKTLTDRIHKHGMVAIIDEKLTDIGNTNNQGFYESHKQGFDAATYCPFPGNTKEASQQAHGWGMGIIALDIMSNPEFKQIKNALLDKELKFYQWIAHEMGKHAIDGAVIGAPSAANHVTRKEVWNVKNIAAKYSRNPLVLVPGIGAQGGEEKTIIEIFGDNTICNVGRALMFPKQQTSQARREEAKKYRDRFNQYRRRV